MVQSYRWNLQNNTLQSGSFVPCKDFPSVHWLYDQIDLFKVLKTLGNLQMYMLPVLNFFFNAMQTMHTMHFHGVLFPLLITANQIIIIIVFHEET